MVSAREIISDLIRSVPQSSAEGFISHLQSLEMIEVPFQTTPGDEMLSECDSVRAFSFYLDGEDEATLETFLKDDLVVQAGFQIVYPRTLLFSKARRRHGELKHLLKDHYGQGVPMKVGPAEILNFGDLSSVAYVSRSKVARTDAITLRVGNKSFEF